MTIQTSLAKGPLGRRNFLVSGTAVAGGLSLGFSFPFASANAATVQELNAWVVIQPDDKVVIRIARSEMGQGTLTGLAQLVAEELECDWSKVTTEYPTPGENLKRNRVWRNYSTGGSRGIRESNEYVRQGGAMAREMLIAAAAAEWKVPAAECKAANSKVTHSSGKSATYGHLAAAAAKLEPPKEVKLKDPKDWKIAGKPLKRLDTMDKLTGAMVYGIDYRMPGMLTAAIKQCPVIGGKLKSFDATKVEKMPGVKKVVAIDNNAAWGRGQAVRIKALSMAQAAPIARVQRSSKCWDGPMLGIATYFLGRCGADAATDPVSVYPDALQHTAGAAPTSTFATLKPGAGAVMTLATYVGGQDPMALYAASRTCNTSVAAIMTARHRRGIGDADPCVNRAMTIIALYLTLFGEHWSETEFTQVIANILNHGSTGYAVSVPEVERQLVDAVQQEAATPGADTRMATAVAAYHAANQFFEVSRLGTPDLEAAAARAEGQAGQLPVSQSGPANLAEARTASLGLYRLTLGNFQPRTITPRVLTQGRWYQSLDEFKVEFIRAKERDKTAALGQTLAAWRNRYKELMANQSLSQAQRRLASTGNSMASNIQRDIRFGEDNYIYVRVSLGGTTVAILAGSIDDGDGDEETIGSVEAVVSAPDSVVPTSGQNAVRGGASFALQSFLRYAEAYGVTEVHSHVITTPSAIIHGRAGFTLIDERDDWKPPT